MDSHLITLFRIVTIALIGASIGFVWDHNWRMAIGNVGGALLFWTLSVVIEYRHSRVKRHRGG